MRKVISLREVVQSARSTGDTWELCATADAKFDAAASTMIVELNAVVQLANLPLGVNGFRQPWLPAKEVVKRRVTLSKAQVAARGVFRRWVLKVRRAVPATPHRSTD